jgi:hypothetical protein
VLFFGGIVNVAELPFVTGDLGQSEAVFSLVVAIVGIGIATGSLMGSGGGGLEVLRNRFLLGLFAAGLGFFLAGTAQGLLILLPTVFLAGVGNGLMLVYERLILQATVPQAYAARVFGLKDSLGAWAFAASYLLAGGVVSAFGARTGLLVSGAGVTCVFAMAVLQLRRLAGGAPAPRTSES